MITSALTYPEILFFSALLILAFIADRYACLTHTKNVQKNWANIVAAALPMVLGAVQAGMASKQKKNRPTYDVPSAQKEALENQRRLAAMEKAPGTDAMLNQIRQQGAAATQNIKEISGGSAGAAQGVTDIYAKELQALQGMQGNQQQFQLQQQGALNQALNNYGDMQNKVWDYNVNQPYQQSMAAQSALTNAAMSNILGGVTGAIGTAGAAQNNAKMMEMYDSWYNPNKNKNINLGTNTADQTTVASPPAQIGATGLGMPAQQSYSFQGPWDAMNVNDFSVNPWFQPATPKGTFYNPQGN